MALPATGIINIMSTATAGNLNGGGFNSARGGTNYSLQNGAQINNSGANDMTCTAGSTTITSASSTFTSIMVGNYIHLTALTGTGAIVGWYEIVTYTDANNVVLDRTPTNGANNITAGTFYVGGAMSMASTLDDDLFEIGVAGNIFYVKGAVTYTLGEAVTISATGGTQNPILIKGYTTTQGDACTGSSRPTFACGANAFSLNTNWNTANMIFTGTGSSVLTGGGNADFLNTKVVNTSTTAARNAFNISTDTIMRDCEGISYRGNAVNGANGAQTAFGCWFHDSDVGFIQSGTSTSPVFVDTIISSCVTAAFKLTGAATAQVTLVNTTLFGSTNTTGIGVSLATGVTDVRIINSIITGFVTGVSHADTQSVGIDYYNDYYNNDTDVTNWTKGIGASAVNPSFTSAGQVTGSNATISGSVLTSSGADFTASGVVAGRDYVYLVSGTAGPTFGIYGITVVGTTTLTLDIAPGNSATADHVYQITIGQNFAVGSAMKALGFPGAFQGGYTTGYMDQGAAQRQEPAGGGGGSYAFGG
jgi:hypothetical protein